jgi:hypothetical protein
MKLHPIKATLLSDFKMSINQQEQREESPQPTHALRIIFAVRSTCGAAANRR